MKCFSSDVSKLFFWIKYFRSYFNLKLNHFFWDTLQAGGGGGHLLITLTEVIVLFLPSTPHGTLGFTTIYLSINVKFCKLPHCFTFSDNFLFVAIPNNLYLYLRGTLIPQFRCIHLEVKHWCTSKQIDSLKTSPPPPPPRYSCSHYQLYLLLITTFSLSMSFNSSSISTYRDEFTC